MKTHVLICKRSLVCAAIILLQLGCSPFLRSDKNPPKNDNLSTVNQESGDSVLSLSLATANRTPPDEVLRELTYFAQQGGGGGTPSCEETTDLTIKMLQEEIETPRENLDGSSCGWKPYEMVTVTLTIPGQGPPLTQVKPVDENGKAAIFYFTTLKDPAGVYNILVNGESGQVATTVSVKRVDGIGASALHKDDQVFLWGFGPNEPATLYIYRYQGSQGTFLAWQSLATNEQGELTIELEGELKQPESDELPEFTYDYVVIGEVSGQVSTGWAAVNVILPEKTQSLVVLPSSQGENYYLQDAPCQRCRKVKSLKPGDILQPITHPGLGETYLQNVPHSSNVWWYVRTEDGVEGWLYDYYTRLHRRVQPTGFGTRQSKAVYIDVVIPDSDWLRNRTPDDINDNLLQEFDDHSELLFCGPTSQFGDVFLEPSEITSEPGSSIAVISCGWSEDEVVTATLNYPIGSTSIAVQRTLQSWNNGGISTYFETERDDPAGEYHVVLEGKSGKVEAYTHLVSTDSARYRTNFYEGLGSLFLYGFQPSERIRMFAYERLQNDPPLYQLAGWQEFTVNVAGELCIILKDEETSYRYVFVGDKSGEVHGTIHGFGVKKSVNSFVMAKENLAVRRLPRLTSDLILDIPSSTILEVLGASALTNGENWWPVSINEKDYGWVSERFVVHTVNKESVLLPLPQSTPTLLQPQDIFGAMTICGESEFDQNIMTCSISKTDFEGNVKRVYATWPYQSVYEGMQFSRRWYKDNVFLWETVNVVGENKERWPFDGRPAYIFADTQAGSAKDVLNQEYFPSGQYTIELYIEGVLVQRATFTVER